MQHILFIDSDVIISSLLSSKGAAYLFINQIKEIKLFISNLSQKELEIVVTRLELSLTELRLLIEDKLHIIQLKDTASQTTKEYKDYVSDIHDAHIVLGAKEAKAKFLITYNIKDFKVEKTKQDLNILVMTPGQFMQFLRSLQ